MIVHVKLEEESEWTFSD